MIKIRKEHEHSQCNSCGIETNVIDVEIYFKNHLNSCTKIRLCNDCQKDLKNKLQECEKLL